MPGLRPVGRLYPQVRPLPDLLPGDGERRPDPGRHEIELVKKMASSTDFIGDFLTVIRNASRAHKEKVTARASNLTVRLSEILKQEGFIDNYKFFAEDQKRFVRIHLRYLRGKQPAIQGLKRISTPGRRVYVASREIPRVLGGLGVAVLSTSRGVMVDREARKARVGGEFLCKVW